MHAVPNHEEIEFVLEILDKIAAPALGDRDDTIDGSVDMGGEGSDGGDGDLSKRANSKSKGYRQLTCNDCNRKFCLNYELPTCKGAKEEDVVTTCFRESFLNSLARWMKVEVTWIL